MGDRVVNRADGPEDFWLERALLWDSCQISAVFTRSCSRLEPYRSSMKGGSASSRLPRVHISRRDPPMARRLARALGGEHLVVDVSNFTPKTDYQGSREKPHLIERFTRIDANNARVRRHDGGPTAWRNRGPSRWKWPRRTRRQNAIYDEPRCHDGNIALRDMLIGIADDDRRTPRERPRPGHHVYLLCGTETRLCEEPDGGQRAALRSMVNP